MEFGALTDQLEFSHETFALPLATGDPHLLVILRPISEEAARARSTALGSIRALVENEVQRLLPHGQADVEAVSKNMALSARTLARRLADEGTTFREVVGQLRRSLALEYLKESRFTVEQIAWLIGYESPTAFTHAFKRWTGHSPSIARNKRRLPPTG